MLDAGAAARARFATSPMWEVAGALRVRATGAHAFHHRWLAAANASLTEREVPLPCLELLVPPRGHLADLLTPDTERNPSDVLGRARSRGGNTDRSGP